MNASLPARPPELPLHPPALPPEVPATPLADVARRLEPRLAELLTASYLETHLRDFARRLRISAEIDAATRKDVVT